MPLDTTGTILVITPGTADHTPVLAPFTARGLTQTLGLIPGNQRRTVNGELIDLTPEKFRKFTSTITCTDSDIPALDGAYLGQTVTVDCVAPLKYPSGGSPTRTVVPGSSVDDTVFVIYRPRLTMIVKDIRAELDEFACGHTWQIDLEEV